MPVCLCGCLSLSLTVSFDDTIFNRVCFLFMATNFVSWDVYFLVLNILFSSDTLLACRHFTVLRSGNIMVWALRPMT